MKKNYYTVSIFTFLLLFLVPIITSAQFLKVFKSSPYDQEGQDVLPTSDGGYLIAGYTTNSTFNDCDVLLIKSDGAGNEVWRKTFGGNKPDFPYHMLATADGNYFLLGYSYSYGGGDMDIVLWKVDPAGNLLWHKTYGGNGNDLGRDVITTNDGNYLIVGSSNSPSLGDQNANLIKIDPNGAIIWSKFYGGAQNDYGNCVKQTSDGGFILVGQTFSFGSPGGDAYLLRLDGNGDTTWTKRFGGSQNDEGYYITVATDGGFVFLVRDSSSAGRDIDVRMIKVDQNGIEQWNKVYGGDKKDTPKMIQNTSDGGYIIGAISRSFGWINPDMWILKCNSSGDTTWTRHYGGSQNEHCYVVREMPDGSYIACGKAASYGPDFDPIFLKLNSEGTLAVGLKEMGFASSHINVYPVPSDGKINVDYSGYQITNMKIINNLGQVLVQEAQMNEEKLQLDFFGQPGIYFLTGEVGGRVLCKKFIVN